MRISSDLLYRFVRSIGTGDAEPDLQLIEIPAVLLPTIQVVSPFSNQAGFVTTDNQRRSFVAQQQVLSAASAGITAMTIATFGRGMWDLSFHVTWCASYTQLFTTDPEGHIELLDPLSGVRQLMAFIAVANVPQLRTSRFIAHFPEDGWALRVRNFATGVGETQALVADLVANLLH